MASVSVRPQRTLARDATVSGIGFLTEADVRLRFVPAPEDAGIVFRRVDLPDAPAVPARVAHVVPRQRRTALRLGDAAVEMVEHVMAALSGLQIDNCTVEIDAAETPGCDGSSLAFVEALNAAGIAEQARPRKRLIIDRPVAVREAGASLVAHPGHHDGLSLAYHLDYAPPIGRQSHLFESSPDRFAAEIAPCRTFLLEPEARALRQAGLGQRLSEADLLVFDGEGPINNRLRFHDECARHKILDMVGDLALAGIELVGSVVAHRSGHTLNAALVRALLEQLETADPPEAPVLCDINQILRMLPHRFPFLLVDRVVELDPDERVLAVKNVTINEPYFQGHWPDRPIMPGVLILEALAQAAGILFAQRLDGSRLHALIASIDGVKMRKPVVPGDQLWLEARCRRLGPRMAEVHAEARVGSRKAAEAKFRFVFVEKERVA